MITSHVCRVIPDGRPRISALLRTCLLGSLLVLVLWPMRCGAQLKKTDLRRADRERWSRILKIPADCEESFSNTVDQKRDYSGLEFYRLNGSESLVSVQCYPGAYQPGFILFLLKEGQTPSAQLLKLRGIDSEDNEGNLLPYSMIDGLEFFDPKTGTLEILSKSRGMGNCGQFLRYRYRRGAFTVFELREQVCVQQGATGSTDYRRWPLKKIPEIHDHP
jgi:hypothetical protein